MSSKDGVGQVIKACVTVGTLRALTGQLRVIKATLDDVFGLNRPAGGLLVIDVSEYQPFRTTGQTAIEIFLNRWPEGNVIAFLRDPIVAHWPHTYPA